MSDRVTAPRLPVGPAVAPPLDAGLELMFVLEVFLAPPGQQPDRAAAIAGPASTLPNVSFFSDQLRNRSASINSDKSHSFAGESTISRGELAQEVVVFM